MSIAELVDETTLELSEANRPTACQEVEIVAADQRFARAFGVALPSAYKEVLRYADGMLHNGLTNWPVTEHAIFRQTIFEADVDLCLRARDSLAALLRY
jgi:hypothetical protein